MIYGGAALFLGIEVPGVAAVAVLDAASVPHTRIRRVLQLA
jgi:hypothetical protein